MNSQELPHSWYLCNTCTCQFHRIIKVSSKVITQMTFGFGFTHFQGFQMPFGAPPIRSSPQNSEISEGFFPSAHRLITEVNATDALHCQQICIVLLASIAFFMFLLCFFGFLDLCPSTCWYQWLLRGWRVCRARTPRIARPLVFSLHGRHSRVEPWQSIFFYIKLVLSTSFLRTRVRLVWLHPSMILDCVQQCCEPNFQSCFKLRRERIRLHTAVGQDCWLGSKMQVPARSSAVRRCNRFGSFCVSFWRSEKKITHGNANFMIFMRRPTAASFVSGPAKCADRISEMLKGGSFVSVGSFIFHFP